MKELKLKINTYWELAKPGIIYGNILTLVAGFLYASQGKINIPLFISSILGTTFVIAGSCVINNIIDIKLDKKMKRTKSRALVVGSVSEQNAIIFGVLLSILGFLILILFTNVYVVVAGAIAVFSYLVLYSYSKRKSWLGTAVGTIPGAIPLTAGYLAVVGAIDLASILLFLIMVVWQLPHFYALGIFRLKDYEQARLPILPLAKGIVETKVQIILFIGVFLVLITIFSFFGFAGITFFFVMFAVSFYWLLSAFDGIYEEQNYWAKRIFRQSLIILLLLSLMLSLEVVLP